MVVLDYRIGIDGVGYVLVWVTLFNGAFWVTLLTVAFIGGLNVVLL